MFAGQIEATIALAAEPAQDLKLADAGVRLGSRLLRAVGVGCDVLAERILHVARCSPGGNGAVAVGGVRAGLGGHQVEDARVLKIAVGG